MAREKLIACYQEMQNEFSDHPELATAVNSLGLIEQRGENFSFSNKRVNRPEVHAKSQSIDEGRAKRM